MLVNIYGGNSLLHIASNYGYMNIVRWLVGSLKVGSKNIFAAPLLLNDRGLTPLHLASSQGHLNVVRYLSHKNRDLLNSKDKNGKVALYYASAGGHLDIVQYLVQEGLDPSMEEEFVNSALKEAALHNQNEIVNYPLSQGLLAIQSGDLARVQSFVVEKDLNLFELEINDGSNALHFAANRGHLAIVKYLIEDRECDPKISGNDGSNALHCAVNGGHLKVVEYLIEKIGCDPKIRDDVGENALHCAANGGYLEIVEHLIEEGYDPNIGDQNGSNALYCAASGGHLEVVNYLVTVEEGAILR